MRTSDFRPELRARLDSIAAPGELLHKDSTGRAYLKHHATLEELLRLMVSDEPVLRVVAYQTLVERNEPVFFDVLLEHLDDTAEVVNWYHDDVRGIDKVADLMIRTARKHDAWSGSLKDSLVAVVLGRHLYLQHAYWMIEDIEPQERYHGIVKQEASRLLQHCNRERAVLALARFKRPDDLDLIKAVLLDGEELCIKNWGFKAIEAFPDTSLFIILRKYHDEVVARKKHWSYDDLRLYCRALAAYGDRASADILTSLTVADTYQNPYHLRWNKQYVYLSILRHPSPAYDGLSDLLRPDMDSMTLAGRDIGDVLDRRYW